MQTVLKPKLSKLRSEKLERILRKTTAIGKFKTEFAEFGENSCIICMDDFLRTQTISKIYRCGHLIHTNCLEAWVARHLDKPKCPFCN